jgi:carbon monoxide dehydrogenase subunit G
MNKLFYRGPSIDVLHEQYAKHGRIDQRAPVHVTEQVLVAAPVARVWELLSDPASWPAVDPAIRDVHLDAPLAADVAFTWTSGKARIRSRVAVLDPTREITWTGISAGSRAVHRDVVQPVGEDSTVLRSEESMAGP